MFHCYKIVQLFCKSIIYKNIMKITQLQFSPIPSHQKNHQNKISTIHSPISPNISNTSQVKSYLKSHQSNKRLKYYSTRNKESNEVINDQNIQILKEEFKKFQDRNIRTFGQMKQKPNKEVFNLIVKKYYKKNKFHNDSSHNKNSKQQSSNYIQPNLLEKDDQNLRNYQGNDFERLNPEVNESKINAQQQPDQIRGGLKIKAFNKLTIKKADKVSSLSATPKNIQRTVQIPEERLNRHKFNKSSIKHSLHKNNNFIFSNDSNKIQFLNERSINSSRSSRSKNQAKRFIKISNADFLRDQDGEPLNPYTQRQYLHLKLKLQNQKIKNLQKYLNSSIIENNMQFLLYSRKKSFLVKTITPQNSKSITQRVNKKYLTMKEQFSKKVRSFSFTSQNKRDHTKILNRKNQNEEVNGWDINEKIIENQQVQII